LQGKIADPPESLFVKFFAMLFFSHVLDAEIRDSADKIVGKLTDIVSQPRGKYPLLVALIYKDRETKSLLTIPLNVVENMGRGFVSLKTLIEKVKPYEIHPKDIQLKRDILDKQIVDIEGSRIVRVNDLRFGLINDELHILGIDVSGLGILRRLGLDRLRIFSFLLPHFIDWEKIQIVGKSLKLTGLSSELVRLHPADLANILENLNLHTSQKLLVNLDTEIAAKVVEELEPHVKHNILKRLEKKQLAGLVTHMSINELVDHIKTLPKIEQRHIMVHLTERKKKTVQNLINYPDDVAGGLMSTEFIKASPEWTVAEACEHIQKISDSFHSIYFLYVVDNDGKLLGVVSLRKLLVTQSNVKLGKIMKHLRKQQRIDVNTHLNDIARLMTKYNLFSVAVTDQNNQLVGIVMVDDIMRKILPNA